jgi:Transposase Tn5 dimerisation domain/Transposase DNA-binding
MESEWAYTEMKGATVWDPRCRRSLATICTKLADHPQESFSKACGSAARQAGHRIFEHEETTVAGLLAGHAAQTAQRAGEYPLVLAVQDTTEFDFSGHKAATDLGPLGRGLTRGLLCHSVLAVTPEGLPLGVLHMQLWARDPAQPGQRHDRRKKNTAEKESQKWIDGLEGTEAALPEEQPVLLLADREADLFAYLAAPRRANTELLTRACHPRMVRVERPAEEGGALRASLLVVAMSAPGVGEMRVRVPRKPGQQERVATLEVRLTQAEVQPPRHRKAGEPNTPQRVSIVCATERNPPAGVKAIQWILTRTDRVTTAVAACQSVEYYARRWVIERWHFTLKSGCKVERLQFDDATSLKHGLALYGVVAWRLLWMTYLARTDPEQPATIVVSEIERHVLEAAVRRRVVTVRDAVRAIAKLGGFAGSPSMGEPGVKSLWLGWRCLEAMVDGYRLAFHTPLPMIHA